MVPMIMNSWVSRIRTLINYFIGNEIFNKTPCRSEMYCVSFLMVQTTTSSPAYLPDT